jgi:hypothetical protein
MKDESDFVLAKSSFLFVISLAETKPFIADASLSSFEVNL